MKQFQLLHRQFLFCIVDSELLAADAQGDSSTLLGQLASLLVFVSLALSIPAFKLLDSRGPRIVRLIGSLTMEHLLIATTMLATGLFAVLSWDATFPDRRDVFVLGPLPVRARTLFLAKAAASATALGLTVGVLNALTGLVWPFVLLPEHVGLGRFIRSVAAYWGTMLLAGVFLYSSVLAVQGFAAQLLSRRRFLRVSGFLQIAAFCLFVSVYFLQPPFESLSELLDPGMQRLLGWLPSYWFLGLMQQLNGSLIPALAPLARRAWAGLAIAVCGAALAFLLSWFRTIRKIAEEPDIAPGPRGAVRLPRFGNSTVTAIVQFSIRTLLRSRRHRLILAFYLGVGFALVIYFLKTPVAQQQLAAASTTLVGSEINVPLLASTIVLMGSWMVGMRVAFAMPFDIGANWIFRVTPVSGAAECLRGSRRALMVLGLAPLWAGCAALLFGIWPWRLASGHLILLWLLGVIVTDVCLHNFRTIPFACSYLPGRANIHVMLWVSVVGIVQITDYVAVWEMGVLNSMKYLVWTTGALLVAALVARRVTRVEVWNDGPPDFENVPPFRITTLGIAQSEPE